MMFGTREIFHYFACADCGCLQLIEIPSDIERHYPSHYFSFRNYDRISNSKLRAWFDRRRVSFALSGRGLIGRLASYVARPLDYMHWVKQAELSQDASIIDIGCGQGKILRRMSIGGFKKCVGIDPFVSEDMHSEFNLRILKRTIAEFADETSEEFDLIMLHHSLEHMPNQHEVIKAASSLLSKNGTILIRVPLAEGYAWETYRENWFQLDAPRHFYLHTKKSIESLASQSDLQVIKVEYDSSISQFVNSELYKRDIAMNASTQQRSIFSKSELNNFRQLTHELNARGEGDQAIFYLKKKHSI